MDSQLGNITFQGNEIERLFRCIWQAAERGGQSGVMAIALQNIPNYSLFSTLY